MTLSFINDTSDMCSLLESCEYVTSWMTMWRGIYSGHQVFGYTHQQGNRISGDLKFKRILYFTGIAAPTLVTTSKPTLIPQMSTGAPISRFNFPPWERGCFMGSDSYEISFGQNVKLYLGYCATLTYYKSYPGHAYSRKQIIFFIILWEW